MHEENHSVKICIYFFLIQLFSQSVQFSHSVLCNSLWPHVPQHTRLSCPSLLPELAQIHVHWVNDAIQPSHPLPYPFLPAFYLSQHQGLFQWVSSLHQVAKGLEVQLQHWFPLGWTGWFSLQSKGLSRVFSGTTVWQHEFFDAQTSLWSNTHIHS